MSLDIEESEKKLLTELVYGTGVSPNISSLSRALNKHRNTIRTRVKEIFRHKLITRPFFPFVGLFQEYPLLVLKDAHLQYNDAIEEWFKEDPHIFAAFRSRYAEYNSLVVCFHKDITEYELRREKLIMDGILTVDDKSQTHLLSNKFLIKFQPNAPVFLLEEEIKRKRKILINDYELDILGFKIIKLLTMGKCIKLNESHLSRELGVHRSTILRRKDQLINEGLISDPVSRFPSFFAPPGYIMAIIKMNVQKNKDAFISSIRNDPHITMALTTHFGGYNLLLFAAFRDLDQELEWEVKNSLSFPECFNKIDIHFYSIAGAITLGHQKISLAIKDENFMYFRI
jgi:hypothetical protein